MNAELTNFLIGNGLNGLKIGHDRDTVLARLGEPGFWYGPKDAPASEGYVWRYGNLEVVFEDSNLASAIRVFFNEETSDSENDFDLNRFKPLNQSKFTHEQLVELLQAWKIDFVTVRDQANRPAIELPNNVLCLFFLYRPHPIAASSAEPEPRISELFCISYSTQQHAEFHKFGMKNHRRKV